MRRKPAPKSVKLRRSMLSHGSLGESTSDSNSSDTSQTENLDATQTPQSEITRQLSLTNRSRFRTPELGSDATDYGLEFTTSRLQSQTPRRCSTLRPRYTVQQSDIENDTPSTSQYALRTEPKKTAKVTAQNPKEAATTQISEEGRKKVVRKPRKQRSPVHLETRFWSDVKALQNSAKNLIPMLPFSRLVREILIEATTEVTRITPAALEALQTSTELYVTQCLQDAYMLTLHRGRVTLEVRDVELLKFLKLN